MLGGLRSYNLLGIYVDYFRTFYRTVEITKIQEKPMGFTSGSHDWLDSRRRPSIPIWARGEFKPALVRLIR